MPAFEIADALSSPVVRIALGVIGLALLLVLGREVRKIPTKLLVLMATAFVDMLGLLMIAPLLPFYVKKFGGDGVSVFGLTLQVGTISGIMVSAFTAAQLLSAPFWGRFSDRNGRRPALMVALSASVIAYLLFGFAHSLLLLFLSRIVLGAGGGTVGVIQAYVADTTAPEERARALGWLSAATNLGVALGPVLGSASVSLGDVNLLPGIGTLTLGSAAPGVCAAVICVLNIGLASRYLQESNTARQAAGGPVRKSTTQAVWHVVTRGSEPSSRLIWIYAVAIGAYYGTSAVLVLFLDRRFQVTEQTIGYFYMYMGAISVFTRVLVLGRLVDRLGEVRLSRVGIVLLASGVGLLPLADSLGVLALAVGLLPFGTAFTFPCVTALLSRVVSAADRGLYMGLQQTFSGMVRIVVPPFFGWTFDHLGIGVPFAIAAACVLSTLLFGFGLGRFSQRKAPAA
jgi:MFS family permease